MHRYHTDPKIRPKSKILIQGPVNRYYPDSKQRAGEQDFDRKQSAKILHWSLAPLDWSEIELSIYAQVISSFLSSTMLGYLHCRWGRRCHSWNPWFDVKEGNLVVFTSKKNVHERNKKFVLTITGQFLLKLFVGKDCGVY